MIVVVGLAPQQDGENPPGHALNEQAEQQQEEMYQATVELIAARQDRQDQEDAWRARAEERADQQQTWNREFTAKFARSKRVAVWSAVFGALGVVVAIIAIFVAVNMTPGAAPADREVPAAPSDTTPQPSGSVMAPAAPSTAGSPALLSATR